MKLVLLGPPGAGKGTLAQLLKDSLDITHISTGDILREEMKEGTELGQEAKKYIDNGELVPDELVTKLIENRFKSGQEMKPSFMLDGFPRTKQQAIDLDRILADVNKPLDVALYMKSTLPVLIQRLTGRRVCKNCGLLYHIVNKPPKKEGVCDVCQGELYQRADDNKDTIETRMDVYMKSTMPIIEYYKNQRILIEVDADKDSDTVQEILMKTVNENTKRHNH